MEVAWVWFFRLLFFGVLVWAIFAVRSGRGRDRNAWGYGSQYGGPEFGIPPGWPKPRGRNDSDA
jgi:hypothetical protein